MPSPRFASTSLFTLSLLAAALANAQNVRDLADADQVHHLDPMSVEASDAVGAGWRPVRQVTATRTNTPLGDVPRSVSVITSEVMADLGEDRIERALDFAGGITRGNDVGGATINSYNVRGFNTGAMYRNGFGTARGNNTPPDAVTLERVEVLKGPASGLFGRGDPGGIVNLVTKRPQRERFTRISATAGSWDYYRGTLDLNTPLNAKGSLLGRFNMALEDKRSWRDYVESQRYVFAPTVSWQLSEKTLLLIDGQYTYNQSVIDRGIPVIDGEFGRVRLKNFYTDPSDKGVLNIRETLQATLEHRLGEHWKLRLAAQYYHGHQDRAYSPADAPIASAPDIVRRSYRERNWRWDNAQYQAELHGQFTFLGWQHNVLLGADYEDYRVTDKQWQSSASVAYGVNIWQPVYDKPRPPHTRYTNSRSIETNYAFNLQDQVYFTQKLIGQFGARYESVTTSSHNRVTDRRTGYERDATVPRAGLLYKFTPEVSGFANVSRSFRPNGTKPSNGEVYDPETGLGYELGGKFNLFEGRLGATAALFHITKQNVLTPHPDPAETDSITVGEQRSRGIDLQVTGKVTDALRVIAAYAYIDAKVTKDNRANYTGNRLAGVPEHNASLFAVYELPHGVEAGASYTYIDARRANVTSTFEVPGYRLVDLLLRWRVNDRLNLTLNLNNLLDKEYYTRGYGTWRAAPGDPRSFKLTTNYKF